MTLFVFHRFFLQCSPGVWFPYLPLCWYRAVVTIRSYLGSGSGPTLQHTDTFHQPAPLLHHPYTTLPQYRDWATPFSHSDFVNLIMLLCRDICFQIYVAPGVAELWALKMLSTNRQTKRQNDSAVHRVAPHLKTVNLHTHTSYLLLDLTVLFLLKQNESKYENS